ncbi:carbohydrate ABC transporter permease [Nonomuraea sediminis]|uniref:carbohydrate ABC transporter permease n=1 Tax=Nonomuraea sediminis TaxID=2835864 RepID=UPI001BDC64E3|nr:carbohydrate ABC transporter permease [Nonomuraea sediminis]
MRITRLLGIPLLALWTVVNAGLLVWVAITSFRDGSEIFSKPLALPSSVDFHTYAGAWSSSALGVGFANSALLVSTAAVTTVALAAPAGYALARTRVRTAGPITTLFAVGMGIPVQIIVIPLWVLMHHISSAMYEAVGWWDDRISLYLLYVATSLPFAVFLLTGFFRSLPSELEEAATVDGAGGLLTFRRIMLPLARPGMVTALLMTSLGLWNETLLALVFITDDDKYTLPQSLLGLYGTMQYTSNWGGLFAGIVIVVLPMLVVYGLLGRRVVEGMTLGAGR